LAESVRAYIIKHPGQTRSQIAAGLSVDVGEIGVPLTKLRDAKAVTVKGQKRATRYTIKG
jgi:hypothetical protein